MRGPPREDDPRCLLSVTLVRTVETLCRTVDAHTCTPAGLRCQYPCDGGWQGFRAVRPRPLEPRERRDPRAIPRDRDRARDDLSLVPGRAAGAFVPGAARESARSQAV